MSKGNDQNSNVRYVRLFVSSDCENCDQAEGYFHQWAADHPHIKTEVISVLQAPEEVVRLQIFYTPALVIDNQVIVRHNLLVEQIAELLPG